MSTSSVSVFYGVRYPLVEDPKKVKVLNYGTCQLCHEPYLLDCSGSQICGRLRCYLDQLMRSRSFVSKLEHNHDPSSLAWWAQMKLREEEDKQIALNLGVPVKSNLAQELVKEIRELGRISRRRSRGSGHQAVGGRRVV